MLTVLLVILLAPTVFWIGLLMLAAVVNWGTSRNERRERERFVIEQKRYQPVTNADSENDIVFNVVAVMLGAIVVTGLIAWSF